MAKIRGDYIGTTWDDFLVEPGAPIDDKKFTPEDVDISTDLAGVELQIPFLTAAMRSVAGKDLALAAGKLGMMGVAPRGLTIEREADIVRYVKGNAVKKGDIESECDPTTVRDTDTLAVAIAKARRTGHSNIPVVTRKTDFVGMFQHIPSEHDNMDVTIPIKKVMQYYKAGGRRKPMDVCTTNMTDNQIKKYLKEKYSRDNIRFVPVIDDVGRLDRLVFLQTLDAYKVGAAIDTHKGWEKRAEAMIDAGVDMIFIDTSDAHKPFSREVIEKYAKIIKRYNEMGKDCPPICGGNVVTAEAFDYLVEAGAKAVKSGMGPGSTCTTNQVLGVGAPPLDSVIEMAHRRDKYYVDTGIYIPIIADGGLRQTDNINVAMVLVDAIMGGNLFGCFFESEGEWIDENGDVLTKDKMNEENIRRIKIYGEASREAMETTGDMKRYTTPLSKDSVTTLQGISGLLTYRGRFKPGVEDYTRTLQEAMYHVGAPDLKTYRSKVILTRLSEKAKETARPHSLDIIGD